MDAFGNGQRMMSFPNTSLRAAALPLVAIVFLFATLFGFAHAESTTPGARIADIEPIAALREQHLAMRERLANNGFKRPLVLESFHSSQDVKGDIYAVVPDAFDIFGEALAKPQAWCDILILHLNTKYCRVSAEKQPTSLVMNVGNKFEQPLKDSFRLVFSWNVAKNNADYLRIMLSADAGPLGTHDYRITLEAIPLKSGGTFVHLSYSYGYGLTGRLAMLAYFNTAGRAKVGFTVVGLDADGKTTYVDGIRGVAERNTMRYYLAIESYLGALRLPPGVQFEKRINDWFAATERYPRQLREVKQREYLAMKRNEYQRQ